MKAIKLSLILLGAFVMLSCGPSAEEKAAAEKAAAEKIATEKAAADKAAADKAEAERLEQSKKLDADARAKVAMFAPLADLSTLTDVEQAQVSLGQKLYHEKRISKNQDISCNSCHQLGAYGVDSQPTSAGHKGQLGGRNSPTVYNAFGHIAQFWDGRAATLTDQAKGPVLNPIEMAMKSEQAVLAVLKSMPEYVADFKKAFPEDKDAVTYQRFAEAVAKFESRLSTPGKWDTYLKGDDNALSADEKKGLIAFVETNCVSCHNGAFVGGQSYMKLGLVKAWEDQSDLGRFEVTKNEADKQVFKVPSLRNVAKTGPYFHDGKVGTLKDAIKKMAVHQLGKDLADDQVASIETFLGALTGELPEATLIAEPKLPASTAKTPKADPK